jgi:hypothetical protein
LGIVSALIITLIIVAGLYSHFTLTSFLILVLFVYFPFGWILSERWRVARYYRKHPEQYVESTVRLSEDSVAVANANYEMRLRWNQLRGVLATPRGIMFFLIPHNPIFWLPQRVFDGNTKREQILSMAREHSVPIKEMA